jgi:DNA-binding SARP family transcriptional activator
MRFGLLGPLAVWDEATYVPIMAGKQRILLAALLLQANHVVQPDHLIDLTWDGRPPGSARKTLHNYMTRLRQGLGAPGRDRIHTRSSGYLLEVGPRELDLLRFAQLRADGRTAARAGAWETASARLTAALQLWRGQPLADVPSQTLMLCEVPRLTELRLETLESRIEVDLQLGRHREVIADLHHLVAANPLNERLRELLMVALYRSGQQAAALAAYQQAWRLLTGELGIEPGLTLRELNARVLRSDPDLMLTRDRSGRTA